MKRTALKRKTPLRKMSKKRKVENTVYLKLRARYLEEHPACQFPLCFNRASQIHHVQRRGRYFLAVEHFRAVCQRCHTWLHDHGQLARKLNWLR